MGRDDRRESFLNNLGRATMRGLRKCRKCGTLNGTRGYSCKNKSCDVVFKAPGEKKKLSTEACRIETGTSAQIYSVRVRDKGPDYRGFVQLIDSSNDPLYLAESLNDPIGFNQTIARCYVDPCKPSKPIQAGGTCFHIKAASQCFNNAKTLTLKNSALNNLPIPTEFKAEMWHLATDTAGPLVQRVSRSMLVVKCKHEALHSLGFLHFSFQPTKNKEEHAEHKYYCTCQTFRVQPSSRDVSLRKCVHLYACIVAFASDEALASEFEYYINLIHNELGCVITSIKVDREDCEDDSEENGSSSTRQLTNTSDTDLDGVSKPAYLLLDDRSDTQCQVEVEVIRDEQDSILSLPLTTENNFVNKRPLTGACAKKDPVDEKMANMPFLLWLGSVTERINQTMHFGFTGKPDPLVFHIPKVFFECLMDRLNGKQKKKRLPNKTQTFIRTDAVPLGKFTKSTWKIVNLTTVKNLFDTPQMPLSLTRSFIMNKDGTFKPFVLPDEGVLNAARGGPSQVPLKPHEFKTILKVGHTDPQRAYKEPTPFIIEWIPDILPQSGIGELRIKFEYDHRHNGQLYTLRDPKSNAALTTVTSLPRIRPMGPPLLAPKPAPSDVSSESNFIIPVSPDNISGQGIATILTF